MITLYIEQSDIDIRFYVSFVYGLNDCNGRRSLWGDISNYSNSIGNLPRTLMGDFYKLEAPWMWLMVEVTGIKLR